ncbi:hypothetical protein BGW39_002583 [Mortierella sp. 14UC]|nr:hypothetical protein BGW39_002583 [Mortierella sp. 14UC]
MAVISTLLQSVDLVTAIGTLLALLASYVFYQTCIYPAYVSPLRHIPGPPNKSKHNKYHVPLMGLFLDFLYEDISEPYCRWTQKYGGIVCYPSIFNTRNVLISDPKVIHHVFNTNGYQYPKLDRVIRLMSTCTGLGLLFVEGDVHKRQRKMLNPAYHRRNIKEMVSTMEAPANNLGRMWERLADESKNNSIELDVARGLSNCTLDIIGLAGFGYDFQALTAPGNELVKAYRKLFRNGGMLNQILRNVFPCYSLVPSKNNRERQHAVSTVEKVITQIVRDRRAEINAKQAGEADAKDLMSILIKANDMVDSQDPDKLADSELRAQIMSFMAAGHETTSVALTWMLHALSTHPEVQRKLRKEMLDHIGLPSNKAPLSYDAINALPYLNACVKEILRVVPPVHTTSRVATQDDTILGYDIPKGTLIYLSIRAVQLNKDVFGEDAEEFKPERWLDPSTLTEHERGSTKFVTSDMTWAYLPFLSGPRNCIGSKFALIEMKVVLYHALINLEFIPVPGFKFKKSKSVTCRAVPGMNLTIRRFNHDAVVGDTVVPTSYVPAVAAAVPC